MARSFDPKKIALWQGRFQRFLDSGLTVARFCAVEDVSESSFYYWQKKLGPQTRRRSSRAENRGTRAEDHGAYTEDHGTDAECRGAHAEDCGARAKHHRTRAEGRGVYTEDHGALAEGHSARAEDRGAEDRGVFRSVTVIPGACGVVIRLPGGTRIEVDGNHLDAIRAVVAETVRVDQSQATDRNVSCDNQVTPKASFDNQVNRNVSSGNRVMRKRSGTVSC